MTHQFLPTQDVPRSRPQPIPDPEALARAFAHVGPEFPAVGVFLCTGWMSS